MEAALDENANLICKIFKVKVFKVKILLSMRIASKMIEGE